MEQVEILAINNIKNYLYMHITIFTYVVNGPLMCPLSHLFGLVFIASVGL